MTKITCPDCEGKGESLCFVDKFVSDKSDEMTGSIKMMKCHRCKGTGEVDSGMLTWIDQGKAIRQQRVHGGEYVDMHTMAVELGIPLTEYSSIEMGRVDNTWLYEWLGLAKREVTG